MPDSIDPVADSIIDEKMTEILAIRLDKAMLIRLRKIAREQDRHIGWLIREAVRACYMVGLTDEEIEGKKPPRNR